MAAGGCVRPIRLRGTVRDIDPTTGEILHDLDTDNLAGGFKAVRDGIADWLGINDGDKAITWNYTQERGQPKQYAARVVIEWSKA